MELYSIASSSSGNCICIGNDNHHILVDVGISGKRVLEGLASEDLSLDDINGIFITHEHSDHIQGLGVIARKKPVPIYATKGTIEKIKMAKLGKIDEDLFVEINPSDEVKIGNLLIKPIKTSHDSADSVMYRVFDGDKSAAVLTDLGFYDEKCVESLKGVNTLLLEANHDVNMLMMGPYPYILKQRILGNKGHLSNESAGKLLCELAHNDLHSVLLGHLSRENNYEKLALETVRCELTMGDNPYKADDFNIGVAAKDNPTPMIRF